MITLISGNITKVVAPLPELKYYSFVTEMSGDVVRISTQLKTIENNLGGFPINRYVPLVGVVKPGETVYAVCSSGSINISVAECYNPHSAVRI